MAEYILYGSKKGSGLYSTKKEAEFVKKILIKNGYKDKLKIKRIK